MKERWSTSLKEVWPGVVLLAGFMGKVGLETLFGIEFFVTKNGEMVGVPLAHLVGGAVGGFVALGSMARENLRNWGAIRTDRVSWS